MSFEANWDISGTKFENSSNAFIKSAKKVTSKNALKKYEGKLNQTFKENISKYIYQSGIAGENFSDVFSLVISNNSIQFVNTAPLITQRYEYGYYDGSKDTNEEYYEEYMIQTAPRYFIRPAIQDTMNDVSRIMLEEAKREYINNR